MGGGKIFMKNILMVCVGNICRSPVAEGLLKYYSQQHDFGLEVSSAGISAMVGRSADPNSIEIMRKRGMDISQHVPRQLTLEILQEVDLVLVMEAWQQEEIGCQFPSAYGKVHRLGKWGNFDIFDPYKSSLEKFEKAFLLIEKGLADWQKKFWSRNV